MALVSNIKWFIDGVVRWIISLKSYEEICDIYDDTRIVQNVINELNTYPKNYYNKFKSESHLTSSNFLSDTWASDHNFWSNTIQYSSWTWVRRAW